MRAFEAAIVTTAAMMFLTFLVMFLLFGVTVVVTIDGVAHRVKVATLP